MTDSHRQSAPASGQTPSRKQGGARRTTFILAALLAAGLLGLTPTQAASDGCSAPGWNRQCSEFGIIAMEDRRDIRGEPIVASAYVDLDTNYAESGARWLLFSVRNLEDDGSNPITIELVKFAGPNGDIVTTRVEQPSANQIDLWVDALDVPVNEEITIEVNVGATERGAFTLETLVMAFDRGYEPVYGSGGEEASLFSFTTLGVNDETASVGGGGGSLTDGKKLPGLGVLPMLAAVAAALVLARRRFA
ncbi:MAG: hypothetical protein QOC71_2037 [Thermoplasmata archaeon]|nr:hypothetical protein [Thermoplasmata archaeon]